MVIHAIDPGPEESALVVYDSDLKVILESAYLPNDSMLARLQNTGWRGHPLAIEQIESMGMAVGKATFETVFWSGRFYQVWPGPVHRITRHEVKLHICYSRRAKESELRQAILDMFGGKLRAIGKKSNPGPLFGITGHKFAALGVALTFAGTYGEKTDKAEAQTLVGERAR